MHYVIWFLVTEIQEEILEKEFQTKYLKNTTFLKYAQLLVSIVSKCWLETLSKFTLQPTKSWNPVIVGIRQLGNERGRDVNENGETEVRVDIGGQNVE